MASLAEELAELANTAPLSVDPEDDIHEETKARVTTESINEAESTHITSTRVGKRLQTIDNLGKEYSGMVVSRKQLEDEEEQDDEEEDDDMMEEEYKNISQKLLSSLVDDDSGKESESEDVDSDDDEDVQSDHEFGGMSDEEIDSDEADGEVSVFKKAGSKPSVSKAQATANQMVIWEKILEARIKLQKPLSTVNKLPLPKNHHKFIEQGMDDLNHAHNTTVQSINKLAGKLVELQERLFEQHSSLNMNIKEPKSDKRKSTLPIQELQQTNAKRFKELKTFRNKTLQFWYDKTRLSAGTNVNAKSFNNFERPTTAQIDEILSDKQRLIKRTQLQRTEYRILGTEKVEPNHDPDEEIDPITSYNQHLKQSNVEIFDDDDFYQMLLRSLIEQKTATNKSNDPADITRQWLKIQRLRTKVKNKVDHKAGKGRKVRYDVHPKLVGFMAPNDTSSFTHDARNRLFQSLFGSNNVS